MFEKSLGAQFKKQIIERQQKVTSFMVNGRTYQIEQGSDEITVTENLEKIPFNRAAMISDWQSLSLAFLPFSDPTPKY